MDPNLGQYISSARAAGMNDAQIKAQLVAAGWNEHVVNAALTPAAMPAAPAAPASSVTPSAGMTTAVARRRSPFALIAVLAVLVIGGLAGLGYYLAAKPKASTTATTATLSPSPTPATLTFTSKAVSFQYDPSWAVKKPSELLGVATPVDAAQSFFFTPADLTATQQKIAQLKSGQGSDAFSAFFNIIFAIGDNTELAVTDLTTLTAPSTATPTPSPSPTDTTQPTVTPSPSPIPTPTAAPATQTAKDYALASTQTTCTGDTASSGTNIPADPTRLQAITVAGRAGFALPSQASCTAKNYTIFIDAPSGDVVEINFAHTSDQAGMSAAQKIVFNSLKFQ